MNNNRSIKIVCLTCRAFAGAWRHLFAIQRHGESRGWDGDDSPVRRSRRGVSPRSKVKGSGRNTQISSSSSCRPG